MIDATVAWLDALDPSGRAWPLRVRGLPRAPSSARASANGEPFAADVLLGYLGETIAGAPVVESARLTA